MCARGLCSSTDIQVCIEDHNTAMTFTIPVLRTQEKIIIMPTIVELELNCFYGKCTTGKIILYAENRSRTVHYDLLTS